MQRQCPALRPPESLSKTPRGPDSAFGIPLSRRCSSAIVFGALPQAITQSLAQPLRGDSGEARFRCGGVGTLSQEEVSKEIGLSIGLSGSAQQVANHLNEFLSLDPVKRFST